MTEEKKWWESETVWGGIAAIIAGLWGFTAQEQIEIANALVSVATGIAGVMAIHGRKRATKRIK